MNTRIKADYERLRKGGYWTASEAYRGAHILEEWRQLDGFEGDADETPDEAQVRMVFEWETEACESWTGEECSGCKDGMDLVYVQTQFRDVFGEWQLADGLGSVHMENYDREIKDGLHGYGFDMMYGAIIARNHNIEDNAQLARIA